MNLVNYTVSDSVATITLNRPPVNALNAELISNIGAALRQAEAVEVRAVIITGRPHFAAGADITGFQKAFDGDGDPDLAASLAAVVNQLQSLEKPTIAAIRGFALGGGLELAMGADLRYVADDARVGQPEILLGIMPGAGGTQRLPRLVGYQTALELCLTGRQVDADEAADMGLPLLTLADPEDDGCGSASPVGEDDASRTGLLLGLHCASRDGSLPEDPA